MLEPPSCTAVESGIRTQDLRASWSDSGPFSVPWRSIERLQRIGYPQLGRILVGDAIRRCVDRFAEPCEDVQLPHRNVPDRVALSPN